MTEATVLRAVVLASGSGTNLQAIIDKIRSDRLAIEIVAVFSDRPQAYALERAKLAGIKTTAIDYHHYAQRGDYDAALDRALAVVNADLVVLAGYMRILPTRTVNKHLGRMLNIHPSLLPAYPGLDTYRRALASGDTWHGTTVHFVTPELDSGPAIIQYRVRITPNETEPELRDRVQRGEYIIYPRAIDWFANGRLELIDGQPCLDGKPLLQPVIIDEPC